MSEELSSEIINPKQTTKLDTKFFGRQVLWFQPYSQKK